MSSEEISALAAQVEKVLLQADKRLAVAYSLPPTQAKLLGLLLELPHIDAAVVDAAKIMKSSTKLGIGRLRKRMAVHGIEIQSNRTTGYWLDDATKERIRNGLVG